MDWAETWWVCLAYPGTDQVQFRSPKVSPLLCYRIFCPFSESIIQIVLKLDGCVGHTLAIFFFRPKVSPLPSFLSLFRISVPIWQIALKLGGMVKHTLGRNECVFFSFEGITTTEFMTVFHCTLLALRIGLTLVGKLGLLSGRNWLIFQFNSITATE